MKIIILDDRASGIVLSNTDLIPNTGDFIDLGYLPIPSVQKTIFNFSKNELTLIVY